MPCLHHTFTSSTLRIGRRHSGLSRRDRPERKIPLIILQAVPRREVHASLAALLGLRPLIMGTQVRCETHDQLAEEVASDVSVLQQQQQIHLQTSSVTRLLRQAWVEKLTGDLHLF